LKEKEASLKNELQVFADKGICADLALHLAIILTKLHHVNAADPVVLQALQDQIVENQAKANVWTFATGRCKIIFSCVGIKLILVLVFILELKPLQSTSQAEKADEAKLR
jgi:hypothetical protein